MKKFFYSLFILASITACNKEQDIKPLSSNAHSERLYDQSADDLMNRIGYLHNLGVASIVTIDGLEVEDTSPENSAVISNICVEKLADTYSTEGIFWSVEEKNFYKQTNASLLSHPLWPTPSLLFDEQHEMLEPYLSVRENDLLNRTKQVLNQDFEGMSKQEIYLNISSNYELLSDEYRNIDWAPNEGEAVGGVLEIMRASGEHWIENLPTSTSGPQYIIIVQADCLGYLFGWGNALVTGVQGQGPRITAGLSGAAQASSIRYLGMIGIG